VEGCKLIYLIIGLEVFRRFTHDVLSNFIQVWSWWCEFCKGSMHAHLFTVSLRFVIPAYLLPVKPTYSPHVYEKLTYPFLYHYLNMKNQPFGGLIACFREGYIWLVCSNFRTSIQVVFMNNSFEHLTVGFCCAYRTIDNAWHFESVLALYSCRLDYQCIQYFSCYWYHQLIILASFDRQVSDRIDEW